MRLVSQGNQRYESEDGRVLVEWQNGFITDCDEPHPMRVRIEDFNLWSAYYKRYVRGLGAHEKGRFMTWLCPGGEEHEYGQWVSRVDDAWTEFVTDTFGEQVGLLEVLLGEKIKVVNRKRVALKTPSGAEVHATLPEDVSERTLEAIVAVGEAAARRLELLAELEAIKGALVRYDELMASDDAEFVDQGLHEFHLKRKAELEAMLA